jgi:hypothetical protein
VIAAVHLCPKTQFSDVLQNMPEGWLWAFRNGHLRNLILSAFSAFLVARFGSIFMSRMLHFFPNVFNDCH